MPDPTLAELFARDPLRASDQDLDLIIAECRRLREEYKLGAMKLKAEKPKKAKKETQIDLGELLE